MDCIRNTHTHTQECGGVGREGERGRERKKGKGADGKRRREGEREREVRKQKTTLPPFYNDVELTHLTL